jgi:Flp pilus assembly protein CpaB
MEMEYRDGSRRGRLIMILGVILALAAGGSAFYLISNAQQRAGQGALQQVPVVVALRDIPPRTPIVAEDVEVRQIPLDPTNERAFKAVSEVEGRILAVGVMAGQMVTSNMLASTATGGQFSIIGPTETIGPDSAAWRAVSMNIPDERAVGGLIQPNQTVDVVVTAQVNVPTDLMEEGRYYTDKSSKVTYQNLIVLARSATYYVVKAELPVAEEIVHLQAAGNAQFSLALRPDEDIRLADASDLGATTNLLIRRYGLPVPEVFPPGRGPIPTAEPTRRPSVLPTPEASESPRPSETEEP